MKTTIDIQDELLARAKQYARRSGRTLRAVVDEGLREVLAGSKHQTRYRLPDLSTGNPGFQFFVNKSDLHLLDELRIQIEDPDWNESVMLGSLSLCVPLGLAIVYNARNQVAEEFDVIIPEIFGFCLNCSSPVLHDAAESCSECGHSFFKGLIAPAQ